MNADGATKKVTIIVLFSGYVPNLLNVVERMHIGCDLSIQHVY